MAENNSNKTLGTVAWVFMILACAACVLTAIVAFAAPSAFMEAMQSYGGTSGVGDIDASAFAVGYAIGCLIPLAWSIPMTVIVKKKLNNNEPIGIGFKICTLLFVNLISGILLLCMGNNNVDNNQQ